MHELTIALGEGLADGTSIATITLWIGAFEDHATDSMVNGIGNDRSHNDGARGGSWKRRYIYPDPYQTVLPAAFDEGSTPTVAFVLRMEAALARQAMPAR